MVIAAVRAGSQAGDLAVPEGVDEHNSVSVSMVGPAVSAFGPPRARLFPEDRRGGDCMSTDTEPRELRRIRSGADWSGYLTLANLDVVAERLTALIGNGRRFTSVYSNEDSWAHRAPEVRTGQTAKITVTASSSTGHPYITISEDGWTSWLDTEVQGQAEARALPGKKRPPYLHFKWGRLEISDHAPAGNRFFIVFAVEAGGL
jgi:hypothetical protein